MPNRNGGLAAVSFPGQSDSFNGVAILLVCQPVHVCALDSDWCWAQVVSRDTQKAPFTEPTTRPVREYVSQDGTAFRVKVLYMTAGKGPIDGYLEATDEFVRFVRCRRPFFV